jgi:CDP-diacylglycerol---serine O-phosphatidyltransferase
MPNLNLRERLIDPKSPDRRPRRAAYALPTFFTAGNVYLGFVAITESLKGASAYSSGQIGSEHFVLAAKAIGWAILLDGLDGRIARMTNTVSEFGKEMDSLADVITFGLAPAVLAYAWGMQLVEMPASLPWLQKNLPNIGVFISFLFLLCGSLRLARFNVQKNPKPSNPGRPDRKYFVGMAIPAAAGVVAAIVYYLEGDPLRLWVHMVAWLSLLATCAFLMVSAWRYPSFKEINLLRPRSSISFVVVAVVIYILWHFSHPALLALSMVYMASGIAIRLGGIIRRRIRPSQPPPNPEPEHQVG